MKYKALFLILLFQALGFAASAQNLYPATQNQKYGFKDSSGNWVIQPIFTAVKADFRSNSFLAMKENELYLVGRKFNQVLLNLKAAKDVVFLKENLFAVQSKNGLWQLAKIDNLEENLDFIYTSVNYFEPLIVAKQNDSFAILDTLLNVKLKVKAKAAFNPALNYYTFKQRDSLQSYFLNKDSLMFIGSMNRFQVLDQVNGIVSCSKRGESLVYYNKSLMAFKEQGNAIYLGVKGNFVFFKKGNMINVFTKDSAKEFQSFDAELFRPLETFNNFAFFQKDTVGYLFVNDSFRKLNVTSVLELPNGYILLINNGFKGLMNSLANEVFPTVYPSFGAIDNRYISFSDLKESLLFDLQKNEVVLNNKGLRNYVIASESILSVSNDDYRKAIYYSLDENGDIEDSIQLFNNSVIATSSWSPIFNGGFAGGQAISRQLDGRWFQDKNGLWGLRRGADTLKRPMFRAVEPINDSMFMINIRSRNMTLFVLDYSISVSTQYLYGLINANTGKFAIIPSYYYMDADELRNNDLQAFRVINDKRRFVLLSKFDFKPLPKTEADFITTAENNYWRIFQGLKINFYSRRVNEVLSGFVFSYTSLAKYGMLNTRLRNNPWSSGLYFKSKSSNLIDASGQLILADSVAKQLQFVENAFGSNFIGLNHDGKYGVYSTSASLLIPHEFNSCERIPNGHFLLIKAHNKKGLLTINGNLICPAQFSEIGPFRHTDKVFAQNDSQTVILNQNGDVVHSFERIYRTNNFSGGIGAIRERKGYQLVNESGSFINEERFTKVYPFQGQSAVVRFRNAVGMVDAGGNLLMKSEMSSLAYESPENVVVRTTNKLKFYDRLGNLKGTLKDKNIKAVDFAEGGEIIAVTFKNYKRYYTSDFKLFTKRKHTTNSFYRNDSIFRVYSRSISVYDQKGKRARSMKHFGGSAVFTKNRFKWKKDKANNAIVFQLAPSFHYFYPQSFPEQEKLVVHMPKGLNGFFKAPEMDSFAATVKYNAVIYKTSLVSSNYLLCDTLGNLIIDMPMRNIEYIANGKYKCQVWTGAEGYQWGILNNYGVWEVQPKFAAISDFENGIASAVYGNEQIIADSLGAFIADHYFIAIKGISGFYQLQGNNSMEWWSPQTGWLHRE